MNNRATLERRIAMLEKIVDEKTYGHGGEQSLAYKVWSYLMNNGPSRLEDVMSITPDLKPNTLHTKLNYFVRYDLLTKDHGVYAANPDYNWDDAGVIERDSISAMVNAINQRKAAAAEPKPEKQNMGDFTMKELANMIDKQFSSSPAGKIASLVLDDKTKRKLMYTIEFDDYDYLMKMTAIVDGDSLLIELPCTVYDEDEDEFGEVEWKGTDKFSTACTKVKTFPFAMGLLSAAVVSMSKQFDELE